MFMVCGESNYSKYGFQKNPQFSGKRKFKYSENSIWDMFLPLKAILRPFYYRNGTP